MKQRELIYRRFNSYRFQKASHEIVKYEPQYFDETGVYRKDEWTCFFDIGKEYEGKVVTMEDYLAIENRFIAVARAILIESGCTYVTLGYVEPRRRKGVKEGMRVRVLQIDEYIRLALRGKYYIVFINGSKGVQFDFSEDVMYMHLFCRIPDEKLREIVESRGLYLDPRTRRVVICHDDKLEFCTLGK